MVGTGNAGSPWVISAVVENGLEVLDSQTVDLEVTGAGSTSDPYVLTASVILDPAIQFDSTGGIEFSVTGAGTEDDPLVVSAALPCIDCSLPGNVGDVLTLQPDGTYAPGPPATIDPGAITIAEGLSGNGTTANPLRVDICTYDELAALCVSTGPTAPTGT